MKDQFFRQKYQIEVLSQGEPLHDFASLEDIYNEITNGGRSGIVKSRSWEKLTSAKMAKALQGQVPTLNSLA